MRELAEAMISEGVPLNYNGYWISSNGYDIYLNHDGVYQIHATETDELVAYYSSPYDVVGFLTEC